MSAAEHTDRWQSGDRCGRCPGGFARWPSAVLLSVTALGALLGACSGGDDADAAARQSLARIARTLEPSVELVPVEGASPLEFDSGPWTIEQRLSHYGTPGLVLSTARRGRLFAQAAWGGDVEPELDLSLDQKFALEQMSSLVTALAALRLVEEGRWSLDEK